MESIHLEFGHFSLGRRFTGWTLVLLGLLGKPDHVQAISLAPRAAANSPHALSTSSILVQPVSQTARPGANVTFSVTASGSSLVYMWFFNGKAIPAENGSSLQLLNVGSNNVGLYFVQLLDRSGALASQSDTVQLTIPDPNLQISSAPQSQRVLLGAEAAFGIAATGSEALVYQWFHNGLVMPGATSPELIIPGALEKDAGTYLVRVQSGSAAILSSPADLTFTIGSAPTIVAGPRDQGVAIGTSARFEMTATGTGQLAYAWHHDGAILPEVTTPYLTVTNAAPADAGDYWVTVLASDGTTANASARLDVFWLAIGGLSQVQLAQGENSQPISVPLLGDQHSVDNAIVSAASSRSDLIASEGILFGGSGADRWMVIIPNAGAAGIAQITINASSGSQSGNAQFYLTVIGPNSPPTISQFAPSGPVVLGQALAVPFRVGDDATAPGDLQVQAELLNFTGTGSVQVLGVGTDRMLVVSIDSAQLGEQSLRLRAQDSAGAATDQVVSFQIVGPPIDVTREGDQLVISCGALPRTGQIEYRPTLSPSAPWRSLGSISASGVGGNSIRIPLPASDLYFRVKF